MLDAVSPASIAALIAFVAVVLSVPAVAYLGNRWMYGADVNVRRVFSGSLIFGPIFGLIGAVVAGPASSAFGVTPGLSAGLVVGVGLFATLVLYGGRAARRVTVLAERLEREADRDAVVLELRRELERALESKSLLMATHIVNELSGAGRWADAVEAAERALEAKPTAYYAEMLRISILVGTLYLGRRERAQEVRGALVSGDVAEVHEWVLTYLDALGDALGGEPESARAAVPAQPVDERPRERTRLCVRAHALAALHRDDEAVDALEALRALTGDPYLEEHAGLDQPASPLARQLLTGQRGPYRG